MKVFYLFFIGLSCCAAQLVQNSTARPEPSEFENFSFIYEHVTQTMLVHTAVDNCYIWPLTSDELGSVHTDAGLQKVEARVIREVDDAFYTVLPKNVINANILRSCRTNLNTHMHYYLVH